MNTKRKLDPDKIEQLCEDWRRGATLIELSRKYKCSISTCFRYTQSSPYTRQQKTISGYICELMKRDNKTYREIAETYGSIKNTDGSPVPETSIRRAVMRELEKRGKI